MIQIRMEVAGETVTFFTHELPDLDEVTPKWLIEKFGNKEFLDKYAPEGKIEVGVGGGPLDEHPTAEDKRKEDECATTLVAKALGVDDDPALEKILRFVLIHDTKGGAQPFDLSYLVGLVNQQFPNEPEKVFKWASIALEAKYQEQVQYFAAEMENAEIEEIPGPHGQALKLVSIVSDNRQMAKFLRSEVNAAVCIMKKSSGQVQILTNKKFNLTLYDVAQMINLAEQEAEGNVRITDWKKLSAEGTILNGKWFFHYEGRILLNGSPKHPDVPPTQLSLERIKEIVRIGINPQAFEPSRASDCQKGKCTSKPTSNPCPWYKWGLHRCRKIRYEQYEMRN